MADGEDDGADKNHEASAHKLEQARERGDVPQSREMHSFLLYMGLLAACMFAGVWMFKSIGNDLLIFLSVPQFILGHEPVQALSDSLARLTMNVMIALSPLIIIGMAMPVISMIMQRSFTFSSEKIMPQLSRISLLAGIKNKFGRDALVEFAKGCVKISAVSVGVWMIAKPLLMQAPALLGSDTRTLAPTLGDILLKILIAVTVSAGIIACVDYLWQRFTFMQRMMMTLQELKDEHKQSEGDPHAKHARKERGREIAMNQMLQDVERANVIVTNPTHYAVALLWEGKKGETPICLAKGVDDIALAIRERAKLKQIPIQENPPLARSLYATVEIGQEIQEDHFKAVAAAIRFAQEMRKKQKTRVDAW